MAKKIKPKIFGFDIKENIWGFAIILTFFTITVCVFIIMCLNWLGLIK